MFVAYVFFCHGEYSFVAFSNLIVDFFANPWLGSIIICLRFVYFYSLLYLLAHDLLD